MLSHDMFVSTTWPSCSANSKPKTGQQAEKWLLIINFKKKCEIFGRGAALLWSKGIVSGKLAPTDSWKNFIVNLPDK